MYREINRLIIDEQRDKQTDYRCIERYTDWLWMDRDKQNDYRWIEINRMIIDGQIDTYYSNRTNI